MDKRVLVVDDDPAALRLLDRYLAAAGYQVLTASNGQEALHIVLAEGPSLIVTDWEMPEMNGLHLCRAIRDSDGIGIVYIVVLTAHSDKERLVEAFEAGADDFLAKPFHREELLARLNAANRIIQLEEDLRRKDLVLHRVNAELAVLNAKLERQATTDELTGLANRRQVMLHLEQHWATAIRHAEALACILFDIDHFKRCNDTHGHQFGDVVLRETARVVAKTVRTGETLSRFGGEEFLVICPRSTAQQARQAAERLRQAVESNQIEHSGVRSRVTVSLGVAERTDSTQNPDELLAAADEAMYSAKQAGRNRVQLASGTSVTSTLV